MAARQRSAHRGAVRHGIDHETVLDKKLGSQLANARVVIDNEEARGEIHHVLVG